MEITSQRSGTERALEKVDVVVVQQEFEMLLHLQQADQRGRLLPQLQQELGCRGRHRAGMRASYQRNSNTFYQSKSYIKW